MLWHSHLNVTVCNPALQFILQNGRINTGSYRFAQRKLFKPIPKCVYVVLVIYNFECRVEDIGRLQSTLMHFSRIACLKCHNSWFTVFTLLFFQKDYAQYCVL